jgi:CheY-like chemotaxis protein
MANILVIDDEPYILLMIKKLLEKDGHEVDLAMNGKEGMNMCKHQMPDLLITDIIMPEKEGLETIMELKKSKPGLKIIAISGGGKYQLDGLLDCATHFGASRVFQKPFNQKEFKAAVSELLNEA